MTFDTGSRRYEAYAGAEEPVAVRRRPYYLVFPTVVLALTVVSLFTSFKVTVGPGQVRPFDALSLGLAAMTLLRRDLTGKTLPLGFVFLVPFFGWHVLSALMLDKGNAIREGVQVVSIGLFALAVCALRDRLDYRLLGRLLLFGIGAVMVYNIGWHVSHGVWTGWKRLNDPKAAFTFLPLVGACFLIFSHGPRRRLYWALWLVLAAAIFMSGERKALIAFGLITGVILSHGRLLLLVPVALIGLLLLQGAAAVVQDPYLSRQLHTIVGGEEEMVVTDGIQVESLSSAQREFALSVAKQDISQHPVMGIGTNGFGRQMKADYASYPRFMQLSFHGEFVRILTENGLIGLAAYLLVWIAAVKRMRTSLRRAVTSGALSRQQARMLPYFFLVPALMYVGFEASGTRCFVVLVTISLAPDLMTPALWQRMWARKRRAEAATAGDADRSGAYWPSVRY
jgi:hypothetical protein